MPAVKPAEHLTRTRHHLYDYPERWGSAGIWDPPSFDAAGFQQRLDEVAGKTPAGHSVVRLVWAWHARSLHNVDWDGMGRPTKAEWRQRYRFMSVRLSNGDDVDISVPRWILEELYPASLLAATWEQARYLRERVDTGNPNEEVFRRVDKLGELPPEGYYRYLQSVNEHDPDDACCERAWKTSRRRCWGYYRPPAEKDLRAVQRAITLRDRDGQKRAPDEALSEQETAALTSEAYATETEARQRNATVLGEGLQSWGQAHVWRWFEESYKRKKHGRWQEAFPRTSTFEETRSGLLIPK